MEDMMLELIEVCRQKEFYCMYDNVDDLIESALNSKLLLINLESQRLDKKKQEVKNVVEQPTERGTLHAIAPVLPTEEPEYSLSMGYKHLNTTSETESDKIIKSCVEELVSISNECEDKLSFPRHPSEPPDPEFNFEPDAGEVRIMLKTVKNQSKPGNIGHKIGSLHQKPDQMEFLYNDQADKPKCQKIESARAILAYSPKSNFQGKCEIQ
nr:hypothetical protein [Tanacetum cinerariifolium]